MKKKELIFTIVNVGFADEVMEKARKCGVKGGTIIHGNNLIIFYRLVYQRIQTVF